MEYFVAVSSKDGKMVQQHFGHTEQFLILRVEDNERHHFVERRSTIPPCVAGQHDEQEMARAVAALSDCKYVLSTKIGRGAQAALQSRGITPLEVEHFVGYAMEKVMLYDKKFKHDKHDERRNGAPCQKSSSDRLQSTEREG